MEAESPMTGKVLEKPLPDAGSESILPARQGLMETDTAVCFYCRKTKKKILTDKKLKDGSRVYVDLQGRKWSGRRCPDCERARVKAAVRCDRFERDHIFFQLEKAGYRILTRTLPFRVEKDGQDFKVGIRRAIAHEGKILVDESLENDADIYVLLFESIRLLSKDQVHSISEKIQTGSISSSLPPIFC